MEMKVEERILTEFRTVAVVGVSSDANRPSHHVAGYLLDHGYDVIPVNPTAQRILGRTCYPDLKSIPRPVEVVDVFRRPDEVMPVVEAAIAIGAKAVWLQEGVINDDAAARASEAGLLVVMDRCMLKEHQRLTGGKTMPDWA